MALTKATYSMIKGAPINVLDYADLVVTQTGPLRGADPVTGWLGTSYEDWHFAIQAALDDAEDGTIVLPDKGSPYIISDVILVKTGTTFYCDGWIKLGNSTNGGGIAGTQGGATNVTVYNLKVDGSNIYTTTSGENGWGFSGTNCKLIGGIIINCATGYIGGVQSNLGGKAIQNEPNGAGFDATNLIHDGITIRNCWTAISTRAEVSIAENITPQIFSNITAEDCNIFLMVEHAGIGAIENASKHSVVVNGFSVKNCGNSEGVIQTSNATNVLVSNGIVANPDFKAEALIRGRHRYCRFENIQFAGDCFSIISARIGTYTPLSASTEHNFYDIQHIGVADTVLNSDVISVPGQRSIYFSQVRVDINNDVATSIIGNNVAQDNTDCIITYKRFQTGSVSIVLANKVLRGSSSFIKTNFTTFANVDWSGDVIGNCAQGAWTPTITSTGGAITSITNVVGLYRAVGRQVTLFLNFKIADNGTGSGSIRISTSTLPAYLAPPLLGTTGTFTENITTGLFGYILNAGTGGNPLQMNLYDGSYPGITNGEYSCVIQYTIA